jgi:hypothetical protein
LLFLKSLTPEAINELCRRCKVTVEITAVEPIAEEYTYFDTSGQKVTQKEERVKLHGKMEIKSWNDLFQLDYKYAKFLTDKEQEVLK